MDVLNQRPHNARWQNWSRCEYGGNYVVETQKKSMRTTKTTAPTHLTGPAPFGFPSNEMCRNAQKKKKKKAKNCLTDANKSAVIHNDECDNYLQ